MGNGVRVRVNKALKHKCRHGSLRPELRLRP